MGEGRGVRRAVRHLGAAATLAALTLSALTLSGPGAAADPGYPSAGEVERSRARVADTAARVGRIEARLAAANARSAALSTAVARAVEAYNGARYRLQQAVDAAAEAEQAAQAARGRVTTARHELGLFAAAAYRSGGDLGGLTLFLSVDGPADLLDRASAIRTVGENRRHALEGVRAAKAMAGVLQRRARDKVEARRATAEAVAAAKATAERRLAAQRSAVAEISRQRGELVRALAAARNTSVRLERARQAGIERERAERARRAEERREAQRRRRAEQRRAQQRDETGNADGSGSSGGGSSGGGSSGGSAAGSAPGGGTAPSGSSHGTRAGARQAVAFARAQIGKPYVWAADGPQSFDCSGLTMRAWERGGVQLPHYSVAQYEQSETVALSALRPGDLVFFGSDRSDPGSIYHVGLYIGGGQMIEAPYTGENVRVSSIWRDSLFGAARP